MMMRPPETPFFMPDPPGSGKEKTDGGSAFQADLNRKNKKAFFHLKSVP